MRLRTKQGITLAELLVATAMVGIIMLGVLAVEYALRRSHRTTSSQSALAVKVIAAMSHIVNQTSLAIGNRDQPGIILRTSGPNRKAFFVRQDNNPTPTPSNYGDDEWVRYFYDEATHDITVCFGLPNSTDMDPICAGTSGYFLIKVDNVEWTLVTDGAPDYDFYLEVEIYALHDIDQNYDPITNPQYTLSSRISPLGHSW